MTSNIREIVSKILENAFETNSYRLMLKKYATFNNIGLFNDADISKHFGHFDTMSIGSQNVIKGFIIDRINFINKTLAKSELQNATFCDMGDSDGIFLKALGKRGISINRSKKCLVNIKAEGIECIECDIDMLPLKSNSIDHILIFETFEHLPNPIRTLQELYRICNKSVFLSIPYMSKTNIHRYNYGPPSWPIYEHHIFEFDDEDFRKIVSHSKFKIDNFEVAEVLDAGGNLTERFIFFMWRILSFFHKDREYKRNQNDLCRGCFKKFSIYHLVKKEL